MSEPPRLEQHRRLRRAALVVGALALAICAAAAPTALPQVLRSYLIGWLFFLGLSLGSMALLMMHHLTGGGWSAPVHRYFAAALAPLPLLALLFIILALGAPHLFPWAAVPPPAGALDKTWYLNRGFFELRAALVLVAWIVLALLLRRGQHLTRVSALGLIVYILSMTVAAVDWIGSLEPRWSSTALGLVVVTGQGLAAFAFATECATLTELRTTRTHTRERPTQLSAERCGDLGNLLLAFVMTWAYLAFVQFLITWAEDLPRETVWYLPRLAGGAGVLAIALILLQFAVPFALLLFRDLKRDPRTLTGIAGLLLLSGWLNVVWLVAPSLARSQPAFHWADVVATLGIGGLWAYAFLRDLASRPEAIGDPSSTPAQRSAESGAAGRS
ncbi:MAG TPA: hypothetical protein VE819_10295 [Steroidobacteraceae bacterium]|jgi:hypothetical protein|nr:hypothetical protein [Steroidobacteraceae bacterium]